MKIENYKLTKLTVVPVRDSESIIIISWLLNCLSCFIGMLCYEDSACEPVLAPLVVPHKLIDKVEKERSLTALVAGMTSIHCKLSKGANLTQ